MRMYSHAKVAKMATGSLSIAGSWWGLNVRADAQSTYLADETCGREVGVFILGENIMGI